MGDLRQAIELLKHHQHPLQPAMIRDIPVQLQYSAAYTELKPGQVCSYVVWLQSYKIVNICGCIDITLDVFGQDIFINIDCFTWGGVVVNAGQLKSKSNVLRFYCVMCLCVHGCQQCYRPSFPEYCMQCSG